MGQVLGVGIGFARARRRSQRAFERRLRRNGFPEEVAEELALRYGATGLVRGLIRGARS